MFCSRFVVAFSGLALALQPLRLPGADRISGPIDSARVTTLRGGVRMNAKPEFDRGPVAADLRLTRLSLHLKPSAEQAAAIQELLAEQTSPGSPHYRRWLKPEEYAARFGASASDIDRISNWLKAAGFTVTHVGRGRAWIAFSGTAAQASKSFHTPIHRFDVNGRMHFANVASPSVPLALADVIDRVGGLDDFTPHYDFVRAKPRMTQPDGFHSLAPDDLATIYDFTALLNSGINGSGQKIAIIGGATLDVTDIDAFHTRFGLPTTNVQTELVPGDSEPDPDPDALTEADLDIEWSSAVARHASIIYVYSSDPFDAVEYAIDEDMAPVLNTSFGFCEIEGSSFLSYLQELAQEAAVQGMTWVSSSGDTGPASCDDKDSSIAQNGATVSAPASVPEVTAVGGTEFNETSGDYWNPSNTTTEASAVSYIPELVWNDTTLVGELEASGGGASSYFGKPVWQVGTGVPADGARDLPDVALAASPNHDPYFVETGGTGYYYGGTSASAPVFAGMLALVNQYSILNGGSASAGLGNVNPALYWMAEHDPSVFHHVTAGDNYVPCAANSPQCSGGRLGFPAGPAYDLATGLGSVDTYQLAHHWTDRPAASYAEVAASIIPNPVFQATPDTEGNQWTYTIELQEEGGVETTLTGFTIDGVDFSGQIAADFAATTIPADGSVTASLGASALTFPLTRVFVFSGTDKNGHSWSTSLSIPFLGPVATPTIGGVTNAASGAQTYAPGEIVSVYGTNLSTGTQTAAGIPLLTLMAGFLGEINEESTPLYYVSPTQTNLQLPFDLTPGTQTLEVTNLQDVASLDLQIVASAPGVFTANASGSGQASVLVAGTAILAAPTGAFSGSRPVHIGEYISIYCTGMGAVTNAPDTGEPAPSDPLALTVLSPAVTIGGVAATVSFSGLAPGYVGLYQLNVQIPANAPTGDAVALAVSVGGVLSNSTTIAVQP